jgi:hypothetical protein
VLTGGDDNRESTIGAAFLTQTVQVEEGKLVKFEVCRQAKGDVIGLEKFRLLRHVLHSAILVPLLSVFLVSDNPLIMILISHRAVMGYSRPRTLSLSGSHVLCRSLLSIHRNSS